MPTNLQFLQVICDAARMQTIRLTCRCGRQWTERVPYEVHDSQLIVQFDCTCGRIHLLRNHQLVSMTKEQYHDRFETKQTTFGSADGFDTGRRADDIKYDA